MEGSFDIEGLGDWVFNNIQKLFFPEALIKLDQSVSKTELLGLFFIDRQGEATMSKFADFLNAPLSTATGIVDRLVKSGYLSRERAETDRRIIVLRLTESGLAVVKEMKATVLSYVGEIERGFSADEKAEAMRLISKALSLIKGKSPAERESPESELKRIEIE
jgi:MarR family transcriptional regulator, organic hydroperoxide resistance regulator